MRIEWRGDSEGYRARFTLRTRDNFMRSPVVGYTVALKEYSILEMPPFTVMGRRPGSRKVKGKVCSPEGLVSNAQDRRKDSDYLSSELPGFEESPKKSDQ